MALLVMIYIVINVKRKRIKMNNRTKIVRDTMMYCWNTDWKTFCMDILWLEKYRLAWSENPASLFALLDYDNMNKLTDAAKAKYGDVNGI